MTIVIAVVIYSCEAENARLETEIETVWKPLVTRALVNGYNPTQVIESEKVYGRNSISPDGKFRGPYVCLRLSDCIPTDFPSGSKLGYPLDHPHNMQYGFMELDGGIIFPHRFPGELFARDRKDARTLVVIRVHELSVWVYGRRGSSPLYEWLTDWYVTFIDLSSRQTSHTVKLAGKTSNIYDKHEEMSRVLKILNR